MKGGEIMLRKVVVVMAIAICGMLVGCPTVSPPPPSNMYCENIYDTGVCTDGNWPQACVSYDGRSCGFKVKGRMFYCTNCDPLICDSAGYAAIGYCYSYGVSNVEDIDVNEFEEERNILLDALEELKETH
jgi:hypothetical protein